jgi:MFS family permease
VVAALLIAFLVREKDHEPQPHVSLWGGMKSLPHEFRKYLYGVGVAGTGDFSNTLLILWATQAFSGRFGMARAATIAMLFYVGYNVVYTASCYVSGLLADRFPKNRVLAIGYSIAVIPAIALIWPGESFVKFAIVFGFSGLYTGVWETLEHSTAATLLPASVRGVGFGVMATVNGLGDFISSASVGLLWAISPAWAMLFVIAMSLAGAAIIAGTNPTAAPNEK